MADIAPVTPGANATPLKPDGTVITPPRRGPGHRGQDIRDTVAEMAAKAQEISMEAGSKMAAAMKDVINAAAGLSSFALESARDLVQYMVRRGQMTQDEANKLIREVEEAQSKRRSRPSAVKTAAKAHGKATKTARASRPAKRPKPAPKKKSAGPKKRPAPARAKRAAKSKRR